MRETQMLKNVKKERKKISFFPLISFAISAVCFLYIFIRNGVSPFGYYSFFYSDLQAQYAPFLLLWKNHLSQINLSDFVSSFSYSSKLGLGKNFMGTLGYYLFSPVNLIVLFFNNSQISVVINLIIAIKLSLASAFMCLFCEKRFKLLMREEYDFKVRSKFPIVLGVIYAFTSYVIIFEFNIMWLDGYMFLPLLLYFLEIYIERKEYKWLVPLLVLLFVSNYYIAYMVGIFSFFYLVARLIEIGKNKFPFSSGIRITGKYILIAILCAMISAVILLPVALDTLGNADPITLVNSENKCFSFPILSIFSQFFLGEAGGNEFLMNNLPLVFSSVLVTCTTLIYFVSNNFDKRIKIVRLSALMFFFLSLYIKRINKVFHAFDNPNWFSHRFAFVIFPLMFVICLEVIVKIKEIKGKVVIYVGLFLELLLCFVYLNKEIAYEAEDFLYSAAIIIVYTMILVFMKKEKWNKQLKDMSKLLPCILAAIMVVETASVNEVLVNQTFFRPCLNDAIYSESIDTMMNLRTDVKNGNAGFRTEYVFGNERCKNGDVIGSEVNMCVNVNGSSLFSSVSNKNMTRFMKQLGYKTNYNYFLFYHNYMMPSNDAFFSMGKMMTMDEYSVLPITGDYQVKSSVKSKEYGDEGISYILYENDKVLPLAFPVDTDANVFDFYQLERNEGNKNYFVFNEEWYSSLFPYAFSSDYMTLIDETNIEGPIIEDGIMYIGEDAEKGVQMRLDFLDSIGEEELTDNLSNLTNFVKNDDDDIENAKVNYKVKMPESGELYINIAFPKICNKYTISYDNGRFSGEDEYSQINRMGFYEKGDIVNLELEIPKGLAITSINFAVFDEDAFNSQFDKIDTSAVEMTRFTNGHAEFSVDTSKLNKNNSLILTTIPFEKGWTCYVDGKETSITPYQDAFIAVRMNDNDGEIHKVELKFCAPGLVPGACISLLGIVLIAILGIYDKLLKNKKKQESIVESDNNEKYNNVTEVKV